MFSPGGLLIPLSCPMDFFWGGTKVPAVVARPRDEATATRDHLPWPPELSAPPGPPSVCSSLEAPSCVCLCVGPVGSPECPPPLPGSTVVLCSGRGELCQTSVVCVLCSRLLFPYMVSFLSSFHVVWSTRYSRCFCQSTLPCLTLMSSLKTISLKYLLVCVFLVSPCCVHRDRFGALLKSTSVVVLRVERALYIHSPTYNSCWPETQTRNFWITSPTL